MNQSSVLIKGVRLYGEGDPVDVLVTDGQIAEIGNHQELLQKDGVYANLYRLQFSQQQEASA